VELTARNILHYHNSLEYDNITFFAGFTMEESKWIQPLSAIKKEGLLNGRSKFGKYLFQY